MAGLINFEDEAEVKEFLDNLGVEYHFQCYHEKDPEGCHRLADYLEGVKQNYESTAQVLKHNCETYGHAGSCYKLGAYHLVGKERALYIYIQHGDLHGWDPPSMEAAILNIDIKGSFYGGVTECLKTAYSCFLRSCNDGGAKSSNACHNVALLTQQGAMEAGPDPTAARPYYEKACSGGFALSCFNLSAMFIQGNPPGENKDMGLALKYAMRACELGNPWGCANASRMYKLGDGTEKDDGKAEELKNRAKQLSGIENERQLKFGE